MEINSIGKLLSGSRMGTRIPEEMLGLPSREERYNRTYSMDAVEGVSNVRRNVQATAAADASVSSTGAGTGTTSGLSATDAAKAISSLIGNETSTADVDAFYDVLQKAIAEQQTQTLSKELASDPEYYKNLMTLSQFSSNLISDNLSTFGASGASIFNLE